jgi:hypothetical protein
MQPLEAWGGYLKRLLFPVNSVVKQDSLKLHRGIAEAGKVIVV